MGLPPDLEEENALVAFAQHIGLPTRLLDWTRSPWTAAYFAAREATRCGAGSGHLAVYAVSELVLTLGMRWKNRSERLAVRGAWNPNLLAQQGVLIRVNGNNPDLEGVDVRQEQPGYRLDDAETHNIEHQLLRIILSWQHSRELLKSLRDQGIHAATLYPGNVGIAELVRELFGDSG